jgi:hypothetical protein
MTLAIINAIDGELLKITTSAEFAFGILVSPITLAQRRGARTGERT